MKRTGIAFLILVAIASCNVPLDTKESIPTNKLDAVEALAEVSDTTKEPDLTTNEKPFFKAGGSEPGWFALFYEKKANFILNYGEDSIVVFADFAKFFESAKFNETIYGMVDGNEGNFQIKINNKPCTQESTGEKKPMGITATYFDKTYKGCGEEIK